MITSLKIENIQLSQLLESGVQLSIARADLIHPLASGNKWYKLKPQIEAVKQHKNRQIVSFGGAFSNHIHALALMGKKYQIETIGIIRGEDSSAHNPTLKDAQSADMKLEFVSRSEYRMRNDPEYLSALQTRFPDALIISEGGSNDVAVKGCRQLARDINNQIETDIIAVACGTGSTLAGIACGLNNYQKAIGYAVLKDVSLSAKVKNLIDSYTDIYSIQNMPNYEISQAVFGGYANTNADLFQFILSFLERTGILLEPIYTGKLCYQLLQDIEAGKFNKGTHITMVHSGGLQGWRGMKKRAIKASSEQAWEKIERKLR